MLPTAVFLACKVEEEDGGGKSNGMAWKIADSIEDGTINRKVLLDNEMRLLLGLKCDLVVHHPSKHVFNFVRMIGKKLRERKVAGFQPKQEKNLFDSCSRLITNLYATDAPLLYEPPELAIAVLRFVRDKHSTVKRLTTSWTSTSNSASATRTRKILKPLPIRF